MYCYLISPIRVNYYDSAIINKASKLLRFTTSRYVLLFVNCFLTALCVNRLAQTTVNEIICS